MNDYETILLERNLDILYVTINRVPQKNSINAKLLQELTSTIDDAEQNKSIQVIVLQGKEGFFCTGMDFEEMTASITSGKSQPFKAEHYMGLLKKIASSAKLFIAKLDGRVLAGGVGIAAACDLVLATPKTQFGLPEAMWGLLPANVIPYLIRRVGFQSAYLLTLSMQNFSAQKALEIQLVDELSENLDDSLRKYMIHFRRLTGDTISETKKFFRKMWLINEAMEQCAINELNHLVSKEIVQKNVKNFVLHSRLPWD